MRCASRMGSSERVKFADAKRASADSGGLPCLHHVSEALQIIQRDYLTRSARLKACRGLLASLATSSLPIEAVDGGCDHGLFAGDDEWEELSHLRPTAEAAVILDR